MFHSYMKVVEIVDRYDTDCVPASSRDNKVAYIQGVGDKICNRTIMVDIFFYGNLVPSMVLYVSCSLRFGSFTNLSLFLQVNRTMKHPVYVYYQLENFYQNHRRYFSLLVLAFVCYFPWNLVILSRTHSSIWEVKLTVVF